MMYDKDTVVKLLTENPYVVVKFKKKTTGEDRVMPCTLNRDILAQAGQLKDAPKPERKVPEHLIHAYAIDIGAWRSFDINTVYDVAIG
jgi:hypothetical protein